MRYFIFLLCVSLSMVVMGRPRHARSYYHHVACECDRCNPGLSSEDLFGSMALMALVVEAAAEEALSERGSAPSEEEEEVLQLIRDFRRAAAEEAEEADRSTRVRRAKRRLRDAKRRVREAELDLEELFEEDDEEDEVAAELIKLFIKAAAKEGL